MFIGGLTSDTTKEMLEEYYSEWGEIIDAVVMVDSQTRKSRGYVKVLPKISTSHSYSIQVWVCDLY